MYLTKEVTQMLKIQLMSLRELEESQHKLEFALKLFTWFQLILNSATDKDKLQKSSGFSDIIITVKVQQSQEYILCMLFKRPTQKVKSSFEQV